MTGAMLAQLCGEMVPVDDNPVTLLTSFTRRIEQADKCKEEGRANSRVWGELSNINTVSPDRA